MRMSDLDNHLGDSVVESGISQLQKSCGDLSKSAKTR
jgi:hypothetical protein